MTVRPGYVIPPKPRGKVHILGHPWGGKARLQCGKPLPSTCSYTTSPPPDDVEVCKWCVSNWNAGDSEREPVRRPDAHGRFA